MLDNIYQHSIQGQQKNYDEEIEELREEVRGCRKEFAMLQELFKAKLNQDAKVDTSLVKELQRVIKKEELGIVKRELETLLEKEVVLGQEEEVIEGEFSFVDQTPQFRVFHHAHQALIARHAELDLE